jgi:hypothetical protein
MFSPSGVILELKRTPGANEKGRIGVERNDGHKLNQQRGEEWNGEKSAKALLEGRSSSIPRVPNQKEPHGYEPLDTTCTQRVIPLNDPLCMKAKLDEWRTTS